MDGGHEMGSTVMVISCSAAVDIPANNLSSMQQAHQPMFVFVQGVEDL